MSDSVTVPTKNETVQSKPTTDLPVTGPENINGSWKPQDWRFWSIILALCLLAFMATLDGSIIIIALPLITRELDAGSNYTWIASSFQLAQTVIQPLCAHIADLCGRRISMLVSISAFALGSGLAGGSKSLSMLISGRVIQGIGSGGILMLVELIICDLVPLRQRGTYLGMVLSGGAFGAILGPVVGGALSTGSNWRWMFYMNLPICAVIGPAIGLLLQIQSTKQLSWIRTIARIDWIGNGIFISSTSAIIIGLVFGGAQYSWASAKVLAPLLLGLFGCLLFYVYEGTSFCMDATIPHRLLANRTSAAGYYMVFVSSIALQWVCLFWPIYFQGARQTSPLRSGINFIPFEAFLIFTAMLAGGVLSKTGKYRPLHFLGFLLSALGPGLNILLSSHTSVPVWTVYQAIHACGQGFLTPTILPAILASLPEGDVAAATGLYSFLRSFGWVWGLTIPGVIFNAQFDRASSRIEDSAVRSSLQNGGAYASAGSQVYTLPGTAKGVVESYLFGLRSVWIVAAALGASGLVAVILERSIALRTELNTEFNLQKEQKEMAK